VVGKIYAIKTLPDSKVAAFFAFNVRVESKKLLCEGFLVHDAPLENELVLDLVSENEPTKQVKISFGGKIPKQGYRYYDAKLDILEDTNG